jgi:hypothetical protein
MWGKFTVVTLLLVPLLGYWLINLDGFLSRPPGYKTKLNDDNCKLIGTKQGMIGSEDLALAKHGILIISSGDLMNVLEHGAAKAQPGGLWAFDMREGSNEHPVPLPFDLPGGKRFHGHGLDISNRTDRIYAISHNGEFSSVDIFQIQYRQECLSLPWSCTPLTLTFIHSITSPSFPNAGINDVIEASGDEVYVTQFRPFSAAVQGDLNPSSVQEKIQVMSIIPISLIGLRMTTVLHCRWNETEDMCTAATEERFIGANGITISPDGSTVYVNDPADKAIAIMARNKDSGKLSKTSSINLPVAVDNIEYEDQSGEIILGTIPDLKAAIRKVEVPGGMAILRKKGSEWEWTSILEHDGLKLSQISSASRLGNRVVLGSPFSEGVLLCSL